jgi:predicted unusual protein kinase regulating ubiquinone biosynthesis (AarF/ABC1/UbiB family)
VHAALLHDGRQVAMKIQCPGWCRLKVAGLWLIQTQAEQQMRVCVHWACAVVSELKVGLKSK